MLHINEEEDIMAIREKNIRLLKEEFQKIFGTKFPKAIKEKPKQETKRVNNKNQYVKDGGNDGGPRRSRRLMKNESNTPAMGGQLEDLTVSLEDFLPGRPIKRKKIVSSTIKKREIPEKILPEHVTDDLLQRIYYKSSGKVYDSINGTSCHQCRQKTVDLKSICRNVNCFGVRGQFCGFCLLKRYDEDVAVVIKDPEWWCPPCRNICNCSLCRTKLGKIPTGVLSSEDLKDFLNEENNKQQL